MSEELDNQGEGMSTLMKVVCVIIPIVALVLYFMKKDDSPAEAEDAKKFGLIGLVVSIVLNVGMRLF